MSHSREVLFSDENSEVYAYLKLENDIIGTLDFVKFVNPDSGKIFVGKIHSIFFDKRLKEEMVEIQLFYDSRKKIQNDLIEFYMTNYYIETPIGFIKEKVVIRHVGDKYDSQVGEDVSSFIIEDEIKKPLGFYEYEIDEDDKIVEAIEPILYDMISSWVSFLHVGKGQWYDHSLLIYILETYLPKLTGLYDVEECKKAMLNIINGKNDTTISNEDVVNDFISRMKQFTSTGVEYSVRDVYNVLKMVVV